MRKDNHNPNDSADEVDEIFIRALEIESEKERTTFIRQACEGRPDLLDQITRLFSLQEESGPFFQHAPPTRITAVDIANTLTDIPEFFESQKTLLPDDDEVGKQIGNYKLLQKIGEGGVGNVYLAEQSKPVRRQVAMKIIKAGMDTRSVIARFEAERQALAMMDHPNIAHVFNAGETDKGRPYFVMELVNGERITTYCDEHRLNLHDRLRLFIQVCHAIQHAHQKGIIHRDIKPSNVLITRHDGMPRPIVIDFGIAKATAGDLLTDKTLNTSMGPIIGTPAYMSPEQANLNQSDIDTRSDIYSLGVLLYELLISKSPFDHKELLKAGLDEMCRTLRDREPPALLVKLQEMDPAEQESTVTNRGTDLRRLRTMLADDLSWIVMKAMRKERELRYESAGELAAEVQRFLDSEPVTARPPSGLYRLKKMVRRNKTTFAYLTAVLLAVFTGLGTSTWLFIREREARISEREARRNEQKLLTEADARARIAQAALLLQRGEWAQADLMMQEIEVPVVEPSLEAAGVFRSLAEWNVTQGRWKTAEECFLKLQQANQVEKSNTTEEMTRDLLGAGPALIVAGELDKYHRFVQDTLVRFANTSDPSAAEQVIKNSLILPADKKMLQQLIPFVKVVEAAVTEDHPGTLQESYLSGWRTLALALYEYRLGNFRQAVDWGERSLAYADQNPPRVAMVHIVLAMAHAGLGGLDDACMELIPTRELIHNGLPEGTARIIDLGSSEEGAWHDWVIGYLLLQEAQQRIDGGTFH